MSRRTIRRYAHELYPHPKEGEIRPLADEVRYLWARVIGLEVWGTGWSDLTLSGADPDSVKQGMDRLHWLIETRRHAFVMDALLQGMTGDEAWKWAAERAWEESGEIAYDRATHYGVDVEKIKPYECGPEPAEHWHYGEPDARGTRPALRTTGKESECPDCTEEIPDTAEASTGTPA